MKKVTIIIGIVLLLQSTQVAAQNAPINQHFLKPVLDRIDDGLARASLSPPANNFLFVFLSWLEDLQTTIVGSIDTEARIVLHAEDLMHITPCLHYDILVLEKKIEEINEAIKLAFSESRVGDMWMLKDLLRYANTRYNNLVKGATDPGFVDKGYHDWHSFDEIGWCCPLPHDTSTCREAPRVDCSDNGGLLFGSVEGCAQVCDIAEQMPNPRPPVCPFDSNYLPPTASGFGCDKVAMEEIENPISISFPVELDALSNFQARRDTFYDEFENRVDTAGTVLELVGQTPNTSRRLRSDVEVDHKRVFSCGTVINEIIGNEASLPEGSARVALRGPFTLAKNEISIVRLMERLLRERGEDREHEDSLKYPTEFEQGTPERADAVLREETLPGYVKLLREMVRGYFVSKNTEQAGKEALPLIQSIDVQQRVANEFKVLRTPILEFGELASQGGVGAREFVDNYVTFMQRSCIFRPCNERLNSIKQIVDQDNCFPYTDGSYKEGIDYTACSR